ncbi:MAG: ribonuclease J, partial [Patescibacteria group bacterium]
VGRNMTLIEYKDTIIVVDAGLQFSEINTPGVDYILANTKYLEDRKNKVKAVIITHGHLDHTGGIPYLMDKIGNPPIFSRALTTLMIQKRQEEFPHLTPLDIRVVEKSDKITVGDFKVRFFSVTHTIPDAMGVIIETPYGNIVCTGDLKLEHVNGKVTMEEEDEWDNVTKGGNNLVLMADSTNVEREGWSLPESVVLNNIENIIRNSEGRLVVATFASLLERLIKIIETAEILGKKIVVDGRSMKNNIAIAYEAGLLKAKKETFIPIEEMENYAPDRIILLVTGAQGDEFASLMRAANKTHKYLKITKRDTILLSSSVVPGNERSVQKLKDNLSRQGAHIIHYQNAVVHSSGHAHHDETLWIHKKVSPRFFIPVHGYHYMLRVHADIAHESGIPRENIVIPDNSMIIEIQEEGKKIVTLKEYAPRGLVLVDGFSVGNMQEVVLRDRQMLSQDGIFVIVATLNLTTGKVVKSPDIISRGFVYLRESQDLLRQARFLAKKTIEDMAVNNKQVDFDYVKDHVTDAVARLLFQETAKRPIVIPVILSV